MHIGERFRTVQRSDRAVPESVPRPMLGRDMALDIRIWQRDEAGMPLLLVNASRKQGRSVQRNRFRRRVRMAFLEILRENIPPMLPCVIWVRPTRGNPAGCGVPYSEMLDQLRKTLNRWNAR